MRKTTILTISAALLAIAGCGHKSPPAVNTTDSQAFITTLKGMDPQKRMSYMREHNDALVAIMRSGDPQAKSELQDALKGK